MPVNSKRSMRALALVAILGLVTACSPISRNYGFVPLEEDLAQVRVGADTRATVIEKVGTPSTGGVTDDGGFYYVSSRQQTVGPLRPEVVEREIVAISFDARGLVSNVERYGLEDGQMVPLARRVTSSSIDNKGFLRQLLGNLGRFNPGALLGDS